MCDTCRLQKLQYCGKLKLAFTQKLLSFDCNGIDIKPPSHIKISKHFDKKPYSHLEWPKLKSNLARTSILEPTDMTIIFAMTQDPTNTGKIRAKILRVGTGIAFIGIIIPYKHRWL